MSFFCCNTLKYVLMNSQKCKIRPEIINTNNNEPLNYLYRILGNECSINCNDINAPYAKLCDPDVIKTINGRVFNLMSRNNETRHMKQHETCKSVNVDYMQVSVIINNARRKISVDMNLKN